MVEHAESDDELHVRGLGRLFDMAGKFCRGRDGVCLGDGLGALVVCRELKELERLEGL